VNNGGVDWEVSLIPTPSNPWDSYAPLLYGGSPAYDESANNGASKYLIAATRLNCYNSYGNAIRLAHAGPLDKRCKELL
jgi:hypothetical protein